MRLYEALSAARQKYYVQPRREAVGWKVTPVIAAEQQVGSKQLTQPRPPHCHLQFLRQLLTVVGQTDLLKQLAD